jgi:hypothetical protein
MLRHIEETERAACVVAEAATTHEISSSSIAKVADLEYQVENLCEEDEEMMSSWRSKVIEMIERIDSFEKIYLQ